MSIRKKIVMGLLALGVVFGFGSGIARVAYGAGRCHGEHAQRGDGHSRWGGHRGWDRGSPAPAPVGPAAPATPYGPAYAPTFVIGVPYGAPVAAPAPAPVAPVPVAGELPAE